jgi:hypothetical protein
VHEGESPFPLRLFPTWEQWRRWSLPSKAGYLGTILAILIWVGSLFFSWVKEKHDLAVSRPQLLLDLNYFKSDNVEKVGLVIRTPENKEIIETAVFEAMIPGLVTDIRPRGNIINGEACHPDVRNGVAFNDKPILHKISITCHNILPGSLNGVVAQFIRSSQAIGASPLTIPRARVVAARHP